MRKRCTFRQSDLVRALRAAKAAGYNRVEVDKYGTIAIFDGKPGDLRSQGVSLGVHRDDLPLWLEGLT